MYLQILIYNVTESFIPLTPLISFLLRQTLEVTWKYYNMPELSVFLGMGEGGKPKAL